LSLWRLGHPTLGLEEMEIATLSLSRLMGSTLDEKGVKDVVEIPWDLGYPTLGTRLIKPLTWSIRILGHLTLDLKKRRHVS